jgi:hypothetical protein
MEKMATYIGTKHGDEAAQEWTSGKKITLSEPAYSQAIQGIGMRQGSKRPPESKLS